MASVFEKYHNVHVPFLMFNTATLPVKFARRLQSVDGNRVCVGDEDNVSLSSTNNMRSEHALVKIMKLTGLSPPLPR